MENVVGSAGFGVLDGAVGRVTLGVGVGTDPPSFPSPVGSGEVGVVEGTDGGEVLTGAGEDDDALGAGALPASPLRGLGPGTV